MKIRLDKMKLYAVIVTVLLIAIVVYFVGIKEMNNYCSSCRQQGFDNALKGIINEVKNRQTGIEMTVGNDKLICTVRGV